MLRSTLANRLRQPFTDRLGSASAFFTSAKHGFQCTFQRRGYCLSIS